MQNKDIARLKHMLDSTLAILEFIRGKERTDLETNRLLRSGVIRELEILGEAAGKISMDTQNRFSDIPWKQIISMRNRLIHAYFDIDHDIIWKTVHDYLPILQRQIEGVLKAYCILEH